jgi:hypothetical protein
MSHTSTRRKALTGGIAGAALVLTLGVAAVAQIGDAGPTARTASVARAGSDTAGPAALVPAETPPADVPPTTTAPATTPTTTAPAAKAAAPSTTATTTRKAASPSTTSAPATPSPSPTPAPAAPKLPPGQRVAYTTTAVQAAASTLTQRIPLFKPTESQLKTFADAVCTSFDQGQTIAQVQATIRDAVSRIQGASLTEADAAFAVRTVTQLRCPGYLP